MTRRRSHLAYEALYLCFALLLMSLVGACDSDAAAPPKLQQPALLRGCGELDAIDPREPIGLESNADGCAIIGPVPCSEERDYYDDVCGEGCKVITAVDEAGDSWALGCVASRYCIVGNSGGLDEPPGGSFIPSACRRNPASGEMLWFVSGLCGAEHEPATCDWQPCDDDPDSFDPLGACSTSEVAR